MPFDVRLEGPVFDGGALEAADRLVHDCEHRIAVRGMQVWQGNLVGSLKHPTGRYQSYLHEVRRDRETVVNDGWGETNRLPYGPWLEGVGSRNAPVTRFPGYHALRRAAVTTERMVPEIVRPLVDKAVVEMNE
jgi:hypothetical protein